MSKGNDKEKTRGGYTTIRLDAEIIDRIKEWRRADPDLPLPGVAVRRLVEIGLVAEGYGPEAPAAEETEQATPALAAE